MFFWIFESRRLLAAVSETGGGKDSRFGDRDVLRPKKLPTETFSAIDASCDRLDAGDQSNLPTLVRLPWCAGRDLNPQPVD